MTSISFPIEDIYRFAVVFVRMTGIMLFAPFFGSQSIPIQSRIVFALVLTLVMTPALPLNSIPAHLDMSAIPPLFFSEILFGVIMGLAASFVFAGIQFAGQVISFQLGFSVINLIDPQSNVESPVFSFLQNYIGLLFFLMMNGHHWFLQAVDESFRFLPIGGLHINGPLAQMMLRLSADILTIGLRIAGPVLAVTIITDIVMAVIGRAAPQISIFIVAMPLKLLVGFASLSFSFYFVPYFLESIYGSLAKTLLSLVHSMT
jgi:flagellar biosynthesis protein FliR